MHATRQNCQLNPTHQRHRKAVESFALLVLNSESQLFHHIFKIFTVPRVGRVAHILLTLDFKGILNNVCNSRDIKGGYYHRFVGWWLPQDFWEFFKVSKCTEYAQVTACVCDQIEFQAFYSLFAVVCRLCRIKYYNNALFYNVQRNFLLQTGDPTNTGRGGDSVWGVLYGEQARFFNDEIKPQLKHKRKGMVGMASKFVFRIAFCRKVDFAVLYIIFPTPSNL